MRCPGLFRCQRSTICLTIEKVCDSKKHCPMGDDESICYTQCPEVCSCSGSVLICHNVDLRSVFESASPIVRKVDLSHSKFPENSFLIPQYQFAAEMIFHNCSIKLLPSFSFLNMTNMLYLDLSYNLIERLLANTFFGLVKLKRLDIDGNNLLSAIEPMTFRSLQHIQTLDITGSKLKVVEDDAFVGLGSLLFLNLSRNKIHTIKNNGFNGLNSLQNMDFTRNKVQIFSLSIFSPLEMLKYLKTDYFLFCCLKPVSVSEENCYPKMDEFSSCSDLMRNDILRVFLWIIGVCALIGNCGIILYRLSNQRHLLQKVHWFYVFNLSISDFFMAVYLIIIATSDMYYKGNYSFHDIDWRTSIYCKLAGVLSTLSSEASVSFIMLITVDCFLKIKYPFGNKQITLKGAKLSCIICWIIVVFLSLFPLCYTAYFSEYFYSNTAVCLALPFSKRNTYGLEYSAAIFIFYNSVTFLIIAYCQCCIYNAVQRSNRLFSTKRGQNLALARRLFLIVLTDFLCWFPIGVIGKLFIKEKCKVHVH